MIKTNKRQTEINGNVDEILADVSVIAKSITVALTKNGNWTEEEVKKELVKSVELAFMSKEQIVETMFGSLKSKLEDLLNELKEGGKDE